jgi:starch-binding outer membrane protein, SusD/RagB family
MIRNKMFYLLIIGSLLTASGCTKVNGYLDKAETGGLTESEVFGSFVYASGFLSDAYSSVLLPNWSPLVFGFNFSTICDEAHASHADTQGYGQAFKNGTLSPTLNPNDMWAYCYANIRKVNMFLQKIDDVPLDKGAEDDERMEKTRMKAEAFFLRAYVYMELLKRYGGVPIIDHKLLVTEDLQLPRNTYNEVADFIVSDCDSAINELPLTYNSSNTGRITKGAALMLKARVLLYAASTLNNPGNDKAIWQKAADVSKDIMDLNLYSLDTDYKLLFHKRISPEIILQSTSNFTAWLQRNLPPGLTGWGNIHPSQNLVDEYEMKSTGKMINDPMSGYNPADPYTGRDPRFYMSIIYNGRKWGTKTIYTYVGAPVDGLAAGNNATRTGYYLAKTMDESGTLTPALKPGNHYEIFMRYAEVLLNYAEAENEALDLPDASIYDAINTIRARQGVQMPPLPAGLTKEQMRDRIRHERMIEMAFENQRFWDVRRWKIANNVLTKLYGMKITKSGTSYIYQPFLVEDRLFRDANYLYPIPQTEINKDLALTQNDGY